MSFLELTKILEPTWEQFQVASSCLPKALLLYGSEGHVLRPLLYRMQAALLCTENQPPCGRCQSCTLVLEDKHPDVHWIVPEKTGSHISIEAIRDMQSRIYQSPQLQKHRIICIESLEALTVQAANALLKVLEEPPEPVYFFAVTEKMSLILPTILSRFQRWRLPYLEVFQSSYLDSSVWAMKSAVIQALLSSWPEFVEALMRLRQGQASVCTIAEAWSKHTLVSMLEVLYYIFSEMIRIEVGRQPVRHDALLSLNQQFSRLQLFKLLHCLEHTLEVLERVPAVNPVLTLESFLLEVVNV